MNALADEKALLLRVSEGDRSAFKGLYDHYWNDLYSLALTFLKSPDWAQDIVQDLFLRIWVKRDILSSIDQFKSYVFIMLRNELISALRHKTRTLKLHEEYRQQLPGDFLLSGSPGDHNAPASHNGPYAGGPVSQERPDSYVRLKELEQLIRQAVAQLPPTQGLLIALTREQGLSHDAVAERLGMAKKTVSNTLTKALNNIRLYLREHGERVSCILCALGCWLCQR
jgi:RNA polymerase sigma-70 factor (family 1)